MVNSHEANSQCQDPFVFVAPIEPMIVNEAALTTMVLKLTGYPGHQDHSTYGFQYLGYHVEGDGRHDRYDCLGGKMIALCP
jgi:hypothetical protein